MDTTIFVGLSHQMAMRRNMDILANNIANINTTAFKKESAIFQEYLMEMDGTDTPAANQVAFVQDKAVIRDFAEGKMRATGNPLDVALNGKNFFVVRMPDGSERYTRNGHFRLGDDGTLVTSGNRPVLDTSGSPLVFTAQDEGIDIAPDGTVSTKGRGIIGKLNVVTFEDLSALEKAGESMFTSEAKPIPATGYSVMQAMIEDSNVEPIIEINNLINIARRYQAVAQALDQQQELESKAINRLARIG
jgi:flagellar basal-body rod protein FlgF